MSAQGRPPYSELPSTALRVYSADMHASAGASGTVMTNPREVLLGQLSDYREAYPEEAETVERFLAFVRDHDDAFLRACAPGHVTGSAFIVDPSGSNTLLVHHRKLDKWLQPGGHCEAGETALQTAVREALEETGAMGTPSSPCRLFDVDIHRIPARPDAPEHLHLDARYLLVAEPGTTTASHESHAVEWVSLDEAARRNSEPSIARMIAKVRAIGVSKTASRGSAL